MELYLIRHAESTYNRDERISGQSNPSLTEKGKKQAELLKNRLSGISFDFVYSSPLKRSYDTARIALNGKYKIIKDKRISEINLGIWEGVLAKTLFEESREFRDWLEKPGEITPKNGESICEFKERVISFFKEIRSREKGRGIIFTHSGVIGIFLVHFLEVNLNKIWSIPSSYCSITTIELKSFFLLKSFNDTCHLALER